jgi:hypothetical protein
VEAYTTVKFLSGGTFTTGVSLDWRSQFSAATVEVPMPTGNGAVVVAGVDTTYGIYAAYGIETKNPGEYSVLVKEASIGSPVQVWVNAKLVSEVDTPGIVTASLVLGGNIVEFVRQISPLVVFPSGSFIDPTGKENSWISLYAPTSDPYTSGIVTIPVSGGPS